MQSDILRSRESKFNSGVSQRGLQKEQALIAENCTDNNVNTESYVEFYGARYGYHKEDGDYKLNSMGIKRLKNEPREFDIDIKVKKGNESSRKRGNENNCRKFVDSNIKVEAIESHTNVVRNNDGVVNSQSVFNTKKGYQNPKVILFDCLKGSENLER